MQMRRTKAEPPRRGAGEARSFVIFLARQESSAISSSGNVIVRQYQKSQYRLTRPAQLWFSATEFGSFRFPLLTA